MAGLAVALGAAIAATPAPAQQEVAFPDANLEAAVREALSKPGGPITDADLAELRDLDASGLNIGHLGGIEHCVALVHLYLGGNEITDLSPLVGLGNLRILDLADNQITRIGPLVANAHLGGGGQC